MILLALKDELDMSPLPLSVYINAALKVPNHSGQLNCHVYKNNAQTIFELKTNHSANSINQDRRMSITDSELKAPHSYTMYVDSRSGLILSTSLSGS